MLLCFNVKGNKYEENITKRHSNLTIFQVPSSTRPQEHEDSHQ